MKFTNKITMKIKVYRILVPAYNNQASEFSSSHHHVWDEFVRKLVGSVTIMKSVKGQWISPYGQLYTDKMIPCEISCTKEQIKRIAKFTKQHYRQETVVYYKISNKFNLIK